MYIKYLYVFHTIWYINEKQKKTKTKTKNDPMKLQNFLRIKIYRGRRTIFEGFSYVRPGPILEIDVSQDYFIRKKSPKSTNFYS